ncbi:hypothetical protein ACUM5Y_07845 [Marinomonas dokdonensis]|uniref:hypothetical protein n=1 Tax=Marinomonas dokdonensis TaxID=328224 RepID=UPI0040557806
MAEIKASLRKRLQQLFMGMFCAVFVVALGGALYFINAQNKALVEQKLNLSHSAVEQAFNAYLVRSEFEMSFISQDLILGDYEAGRELETLFGHHEILFFGGLDFFYIEWSDGRQSIDPRARLFTKVDLSSLIIPTEISQWVKRTTSDGASLLIYKKKLISKEGENLGFLYGFISLNGNLTLAHELHVSAQADMVRIYDQASGQIVLEEHANDFEPSLSLLRSTQVMKTPVQAQLQLELSQQGYLTGNVLSKSIVPMVVIVCVLLGLCFLLLIGARHLIFAPLKRVQTASPNNLPFNEFAPIQQQNSHYRALIEGKDRRFHVLLEASDNVIIFCSEIAEIEMMNGQAKSLFPDHKRAKTVFDFMPIHCHQPIQDALKGASDIAFELTFQDIGQIYHWQVMSFRNEYAYRGLLLIGTNMTQEMRLTWQLEQLDPNSDFMQSRAEGSALLAEMDYLSTQPFYDNSNELQGWLSLLVSVFECLKSEPSQEDMRPLGDLLSEESIFVASALKITSASIQLLCSTNTGSQLVPNSGCLRSLIRVVLMTSYVLNKSINVEYEANQLVLKISGDVNSRPLIAWLIQSLLEKLSGTQQETSTGLRLDLGLPRVGTGENPAPLSLVVAWVSLDYPHEETVQALLRQLGVRVECYNDADSFFTQSRMVERFDAVIIGCLNEGVAQQKMTQSLQEQYGKENLPLLWLNSQSEASHSESDIVTLSGGIFEYYLYQGLRKASSKGTIFPSAFGEQGVAWIVVGGSRVSRAIWFSGLELCSIPSHWLESLSAPTTLLSYYRDAVMVLLEPQDEDLIENVQSHYPNVTFVAVQNWPQGIPERVQLFEMNLPYSSEQIAALSSAMSKETNKIEE